MSLVGPVRAQELLGIDVTFGDVYRMDAKTGRTSYVGYTGLDQDLWHSMAKDSQGRIFGGYGDDLHPYGIYEIDPNTGLASFIVQTDRVNLMGLAFGPGDVLFATDRWSLIHPVPSDLYTVDLSTGTTTIVGSTGFGAVQGLAYGQGSLWGWDLTVGLLKIDPLTGVATDVNPSINDGVGLVQTICFSDDGVLYAGFFATFVVDLATGAPSYVNYLPGAFLVAGMEFLPNQPAPFSLGVSGETGGPMGAFVAGATPGGNVAFFATRGYGGPTQILPGHACAGTFLDLNARLRLISLAQADAAGKAEIGPVQVAWYPTGALRLQALDVTTCATSNRARVVY